MPPESSIHLLRTNYSSCALEHRKSTPDTVVKYSAVSIRFTKLEVEEMWRSLATAVVCITAVFAWWSLPGSMRVHSAGLGGNGAVLVPAGDDQGAGH